MATRVSEEGQRVRPSKSLRAAIKEANGTEAAKRQHASEQLRRERDAQLEPNVRWIRETDQEKRRRLAARKKERELSQAQRRSNPDQAFVDDHVETCAQTHGDYVKDTTPGPNIIQDGEEKATSIDVVRNRGGTAIERWFTRGDLDRRQIEAIAIYQRAWRLFYGGEQRVTAKWSLVTSIRGGSMPIEAYVANALNAKALLRHFDQAIFFALPLHYLNIWSNVLIFDEPTGVAGGRLGYKSKQAEAAAKAIIILIADMIATDQRLGNER